MVFYVDFTKNPSRINTAGWQDNSLRKEGMIPSIEIDNSGMLLAGKPRRNAIVAITGLPRSGTTYVTQLLAAAGVLPLYHVSNEPNLEEYRNLEDLKMAAAIEGDDQKQLRLTVAGRPERWMFKQPNLHHHHTRLREALSERLAWVFVFRDPLAIAIRESLTTKRSLWAMLGQVAESTQKLVEVAGVAPEPKCLVSFEKARQFPCHVKYHFAKWIEPCES